MICSISLSKSKYPLFLLEFGVVNAYLTERSFARRRPNLTTSSAVTQAKQPRHLSKGKNKTTATLCQKILQKTLKKFAKIVDTGSMLWYY